MKSKRLELSPKYKVQWGKIADLKESTNYPVCHIGCQLSERYGEYCYADIPLDKEKPTRINLPRRYFDEIEAKCYDEQYLEHINNGQVFISFHKVESPYDTYEIKLITKAPAEAEANRKEEQ